MKFHHWCVVSALLVGISNVAGAQDDVEKFNRIHATIRAVFTGKDFSIWQGTEGDFNGDGIRDYAAVVVLKKYENESGERLVVFAGTSDENFKPISVSGRFCEPQKFYGLRLEKNTLFVQVVNYSDSSNSSSYTLQFRYNATLKDFELIGREEIEENYDDGSFYSVSTNYLTKTEIQTRQSGKNKKKVVVRHKNVPAVSRLQGFECTSSGKVSEVPVVENPNLQNQ